MTPRFVMETPSAVSADSDWPLGALAGAPSGPARSNHPNALFRGQFREGWVYFIVAGPLVKIGFTGAHDPLVRIKAVMAKSPSSRLLGRVRAYMTHERAMHVRMAAYRAHGEWFRFSGACRSTVEAILREAASE